MKQQSEKRTPTPIEEQTPTPSNYINIEEKIENSSEDKDKFYKIRKEDDESYTLELYSKDNVIIDAITVPNEPEINILDNNIIQVIISYGSPFYATYFYDVEN